MTRGFLVLLADDYGEWKVYFMDLLLSINVQEVYELSFSTLLGS